MHATTVSFSAKQVAYNSGRGSHSIGVKLSAALMLSLDNYTDGSGVPAAWISGYAVTVSNDDNSIAQHTGDLGIILATDESTSCGKVTESDTTITVNKHELDLNNAKSIGLSDIELSSKTDIGSEASEATSSELLESNYKDGVSLCPTPICTMTETPESIRFKTKVDHYSDNTEGFTIQPVTWT